MNLLNSFNNFRYGITFMFRLTLAKEQHANATENSEHINVVVKPDNGIPTFIFTSKAV